MIDIDKLRQALWAVQPEEVEELLDRLEAAESAPRDDYQNWMTALDRNAELLAKLEAAEQTVQDYLRIDREEAQIAQQLEAAEKERDDVAQQLVQSEIGKREISEARDALQVEVGKLKDLEVTRCVKINGYIVDNARLAEEVERLKAKIEQMEQQEPIKYECRRKPRNDVAWGLWKQCFKSSIARWGSKTSYQDEHFSYEVRALYALPGAQGEEK